MKTPNDYIREMAEEGRFGQYFLTLFATAIVVSAIAMAIIVYVVPIEVLYSIVDWFSTF